jgi:dTDP-4-amino-4,6-dideoxygalactose transaminase/predicted dehydrogenase
MDFSVKEDLPNKQQTDSNNQTSGRSGISERMMPNFQSISCSSELIARDHTSLDQNGRIKRIGLVGNGGRGKKFIKAIEAVPRLKLVAICDINGFTTEDIPVFKSVDEMIKIPLDVGIVCVPHDEHFVVSRKLIEHGIHVLKEKPFALSSKEAEELQSLANENHVKLMISTQKRFFPAYVKCKEMIMNGVLGSISCIDARYTLDAVNPKTGNWRTKKSADIVLDMGYHMLDIITWLFGVPEEVYGLTNEQDHYQSVEAGDTSSITFSKVFDDGKAAIGNIFLARYFHEKQEYLTIIGTKGSIVIKDGQEIKHFGADRTLISEEHFFAEPLQNVLQQFMEDIDISDQSPLNNSSDQVVTMKFVDALRNNVTSSDYTWPVITPAARKAVNQQLSQSISIYNKSGIIKDFEDKFAAYHGRTYGLLSNSGTNAIYSMFFGLGFQPGDEVIVPVYTFFATASPLAHLGVKVVFADCEPGNCNIDPSEIEKKITPRTKAVVVTHMWGMPCNMDEIVAICNAHKLKLLEDCSHAHGAEYRGRKVGTFGIAAAWSLQGPKIITGGEGGIMLTDDSEIYYKALLQGHYNKRCITEIPEAFDLKKFDLTGAGLKFRSHPLAVALAAEQFTHLDNWLNQKSKFVSHIVEKLTTVPFLKFPEFDPALKKPAWYALVFQFVDTKSKATIEEFYGALKGHGLPEVDRPLSTGLLNKLPLFTEPHLIFPALYSNQTKPDANLYPNAQLFYKNAIKLPVWAFPEDADMVEKYINGILAVAERFTQK